jgi:hypothetical protein
VLVVVGYLLVVGPGAVAAAETASPTQPAIQEESNESLTLEDADKIHIEIQIAENGSATPIADYRYHLGNESQTEQQWEDLREDVNSSPQTYIDEEAASWRETLEAGENRTDREMNISSFDVQTDRSSTPREYGHVEFTFEWSSFAYVELNQLEAGDALDEFMLDDGTELRMVWPETYNATGYDPEPESVGENSALWVGDSASFDDNQPRLELIEAGSEANNAPSDGGMPWESSLVVLAGIALLGLGVGAGWLLKRDGGDGPEQTQPSDPAPPPPQADPKKTPPQELLSNEERVLRLLEAEGGRLKQQQVVAELEWTEAKTSQVVTSLREDGEIDVFGIGRENVLALPEERGQSQQ